MSEERIAKRLLADLSVVTSSVVIAKQAKKQLGFGGKERIESRTLDYELRERIYERTPGMVADKIKRVLLTVHEVLQATARRGLIFAYDEAQNLSDHRDKDEFPMSLLLDVFQSIQKVGVRFMLVLTGLPTLFPKLVEARTFAERMFHVVQLERLNHDESRDAILKPLEGAPLGFDERSVAQIIRDSGGYPYFIQFICREAQSGQELCPARRSSASWTLIFSPAVGPARPIGSESY